MDLLNLIPTDDTLVVTIKHPVTEEILNKDNGEEMTITVYAPHSSVYKAALHEQTNKRLQKMAKGKKLNFTAEDVEMSSIDLLVKTTKDWNIQFDGKSPKFTASEAVELYTKAPWLKNQILEAQEDFSSFLKS